MFIDQNPYARIVHAGLCSVGFQIFLFSFGVSLVLCNKELPSGLIILCFRVHECDSLVVVLDELRCSFLHFLCPFVP